jgi:hypothetical protein
MIMGFTGSRKGMNGKQVDEFRRLVLELAPTEFHHGGCVGADLQAHNVVSLVAPKCQIVVHPSTLETWSVVKIILRCLDKKRVELRPEEPPLERNKDIVTESDCLVVAPRSNVEILRSGTWSTFRYARKVGSKSIHLLLP